MNLFQTVIKIVGSAWGGWSIAAFALGIFFWISSAVIKKARPGKFDSQQTYRFFRLAMVLAFLLALATLVTATVKEVFVSGREPRAERIQRFARALKSDDPTVRRQAIEELVPYGGDAAREVVKVVSEESHVIAAEMLQRATGGDLTDIFSGFLGRSPWQTPFMESATDCLVRIGQPSVPYILDELAQESIQAERLLQSAATQSATQRQPDLADTINQWRFLFGAANQGMWLGIARDVYQNILLKIGEPAVPSLLEGLGSPRLLVRMTSYQVLAQTPTATKRTIQKLQEIASHASDASEQRQLAIAIRQLEATVH